MQERREKPTKMPAKSLYACVEPVQTWSTHVEKSSGFVCQACLCVLLAPLEVAASTDQVLNDRLVALTLG